MSDRLGSGSKAGCPSFQVNRSTALSRCLQGLWEQAAASEQGRAALRHWHATVEPSLRAAWQQVQPQAQAAAQQAQLLARQAAASSHELGSKAWGAAGPYVTELLHSAQPYWQAGKVGRAAAAWPLKLGFDKIVIAGAPASGAAHSAGPAVGPV